MAADAARRAHDELDRADAEVRDLDGRIRVAEEALRPAHEDLGCAKAAEVREKVLRKTQPYEAGEVLVFKQPHQGGKAGLQHELRAHHFQRGRR